MLNMLFFFVCNKGKYRHIFLLARLATITNLSEFVCYLAIKCLKIKAAFTLHSAQIYKSRFQRTVINGFGCSSRVYLPFSIAKYSASHAFPTSMLHDVAHWKNKAGQVSVELQVGKSGGNSNFWG